MNYDYYYNNVPGKGLCRNNLIYTSLISSDKKTFVQWYHNDTKYHMGQNQVVDPELMKDKWSRELCFLTHMSKNYPDLVPKIQDIDLREKKIYLEIDGVDFWERAGCLTENYDSVVPDWQEQMIEIVKAHKSIDIFKYSMHPSSYFVVDGQLKSINYFFCYSSHDQLISVSDVESHISVDRREEMKKHLGSLNINWNDKQSFETLEKLCWESFSNNYPKEFIEKIKCIK